MAIAQAVAQGAPSDPPARLSCASFPQGDAQSLERPLLVMRRSGVQIPEAALSQNFLSRLRRH